MWTHRVLAATLTLLSMSTTPSLIAEPKCVRPLQDYEVTFLVALLPDVQAEYRRGETVRFAKEDAPDMNGEVYSVVRVVTETDDPSGLVGYYTVNKYTADVSGLGGPENGEDLRAAQELIRRTHCFDSDVISRYRDAPLQKGPQ